MSTPLITKPVFEHHHTGLGVDTATPRISWRFEVSSTSVESWVQDWYEIEVLFDSASKPQIYRVESDQSVLVPWPARPLKSREMASVRVRVHGKSLENTSSNTDGPSAWSATAEVEAALLDKTDFKANFITASEQIDSHGPLRPIRFRKEFNLPAGGKTMRARLYLTACGVFEAWVNGQRVGDECLAPGWTSYKHRLTYRVHDVTSMLLHGQRNAVAVEVAEGWYCGRLGFHPGKSFLYGGELGVYVQMEVHRDGSTPWTLVSDASWSSIASALISAELYDGEVYDMNDELDGWNMAGVPWPSERMLSTKNMAWPTASLVAPDAPPIRVTETKACEQIFRSGSGKVILDFGQNLVGKLFIPFVTTGKGDKIEFRHAEVMEDGELGTRPLQSAKAQDIIIGSGRSLRAWAPRYTYHGFRYVEVTGWPGDGSGPSLSDIQVLVIHTDMRRRGHFHCSNAFVNKLHANVVWSMRGNFLSLPTDCPQRDERLGWTGDIQVFSPTANFLYDTIGILSNWLQDVAAEQLEDKNAGIPPLVVPYALVDWPHFAQAIWDDVTILLPNELFHASSDRLLLERQFTSMEAWLEHGVDRAPDGLWNPDEWQLGDWLDPNAPPEDPGNGRTDSILVANAYLIHTTQVFSRLCAILGKPDLARKYAEESERLKQLFQRRYITPEGNLMSTSQTAISLAIRFDLYPNITTQRRTAAQALERLVRMARFNITTGFAGTPVISHALTAIGKPQLAYRMLLETTCPSWLYPIVHKDATTIWERWDSMLPDGRINPGSMTSFNHYSLGAVADWLHTSVGGISPLEPGWRVVRVRPVPGGNLKHARVSFDGPYGLIECDWNLGECEFNMKLTIPPNSKAMVTLPSELRKNYEGEEFMREVGSGRHIFSCRFEADAWPPKPLIARYMRMPPDTIAE